MIFKHYGKEISRDRINNLTQKNKIGTSLLGLSEVAEKLGFRTTSVKVTFDQLLDEAPIPCVLYWDNYHFVVLTPSSNKRKLIVADPSKGLISYSKEEFMKYWSLTGEGGKGVALLLIPGSTFYQQEEDQEKKLGLKLISAYLSNYKTQLGQLAIGLILGSLIQLVFPYLTQSIVDTGILTGDLNFIQVILLAQFVLFFSQIFIEFIRSRILLFISTQVNLSLLSDFWIKLLRLPINFFESRSTGDILQRINDHKRIESFITGSALQTMFSGLNLIVFSIVLLTYNALIFLIFILGSTLYFFWIIVFFKKRRAIDINRFLASAKENSITMQIISGITDLKLNNATRSKRLEWEGAQARLFKLTFKSLTLSQYQQAGGVFINQGKNLMITYIVAITVLDGGLTLGAMLAIQFIIGQLNGPVEQLVFFSQQAQDAKLSLERLNEIHELEEEEPEHRNFLDKIRGEKNISFQRVVFSYSGDNDTRVLNNISMEIPSGKVTAIVGTSGSGKTTILKIIQKLYDSYQGEIKIGDCNLRNLSPNFWRGITGSVMQDGFIFADTVAKNIALGHNNPDISKLIQACKIANILNFVESLPLGFDTKIGSEGIGISSGQKQRILIARAVFKDPQFLIFDEATNALDTENEFNIMVNLHDFFKGRTVIIVAHRLSTVKSADKIIVLDNGKVIEEGGHSELIQKKSKYFGLVRSQFELDR
jgi:ATP-binding cassette subfamily B protein